MQNTLSNLKWYQGWFRTCTCKHINRSLQMSATGDSPTVDCDKLHNSAKHTTPLLSSRYTHHIDACTHNTQRDTTRTPTHENTHSAILLPHSQLSSQKQHVQEVKQSKKTAPEGSQSRRISTLSSEVHHTVNPQLTYHILLLIQGPSLRESIVTGPPCL